MIGVAITVVFFFSVFGVAHMLIPRERYVTFYLVAVVLSGVAFGRDLPDLYWLQKDGIAAQGTIRHLDCANHGHITYEFQVDKQSFSNVERASAGGLNCNDMRIGMEVPVRFLASSPEISVSGKARQRFTEELEFAVAAILGFPALVLFLYFRKRRQS